MNSKRSSSKKPPPPNPNLNRTQSPSKSKNHNNNKKSKPHPQENPNPNPSPPPPPPAMASPASKKRKSREPDDADALTILEAVIDFRAENRGANPTPTNMGPLFESVRDTLHADYTLDQLYNRIRHLRQKYYRQLESRNVGSSPHDQAFHELSARAWADSKKRSGAIPNGAAAAAKPKAEVKPKPEKEEDDGVVGGDEEMEDAEMGGGEGGGDSFGYLSHQAREYWQAMGMTAESLEMGLKAMDRAKAKLLEKKWAQHGDAGLKIQAKQSEIERDLFLALHAARKGTN